MKQYKLIRTFKDSPPLNAYTNINTNKNNCIIYKPNGEIFSDSYGWRWVEDYPEFWEEIISKNYEILLFIDSKGILRNVTGFGQNWYDSKFDKIHSVKRLSDGEIFSIGDKTGLTNGNGYKCPILKFELSYNESRGHTEKYRNRETLKFTLGTGYDNKNEWGPFELELLRPIPKKLFTTEDSVNIFENDKYYTVNGFYNMFSFICKSSEISALNPNVKRFSTKEAAEDYVIMNKPCLSVNDITELYNTFVNDFYVNRLKKLVKSKL